MPAMKCSKMRTELQAVYKVFEQMLEDVDFEM